MSDTVKNHNQPTGTPFNPSDACPENMVDVNPTAELGLDSSEMPRTQVKFIHKSSFSCSLCDEELRKADGATSSGSRPLVQFREISYLSQLQKKHLSFKRKPSKKSSEVKSDVGGGDQAPNQSQKASGGESRELGIKEVCLEEASFLKSESGDLRQEREAVTLRESEEVRPEDQDIPLVKSDLPRPEELEASSHKPEAREPCPDELKVPLHKPEAEELCSDELEASLHKPEAKELCPEELEASLHKPEAEEPCPEELKVTLHKPEAEELETPLEKPESVELRSEKLVSEEFHEGVLEVPELKSKSEELCLEVPSLNSESGKFCLEEEPFLQSTDIESDSTVSQLAKEPGIETDDLVTQLSQDRASVNDNTGVIERKDVHFNETIKAWEEGDECVAKWAEDGRWYKSIITKIDEDQVTVTFTDYGNSGWTTREMLRHPDTGIDENGQIYQRNDKENGEVQTDRGAEAWKEDDQCVAEWVEDGCWYRSVIEKIESKDRVLVKFIDYGNSDYTSLNNLKPFDTEIDENGQIFKNTVSNENDNQRPVEDGLEAKEWKEGDKCVAQWAEDSLWYKSIIEKIESPDKVLVNFIEYGNSDYTTLSNLKPFNTMIDKNGQIDDQNESNVQPELKTMLKDVEQMDYSSRGVNNQIDGTWKVGDDCLAKWNEDNCWYKSKIIRMDSEENILVEFTEYGNSDFTSLSMLKPMNTEIINGQLKIHTESHGKDNDGSTLLSEESNEKWKVGDACVAQWRQDGLWYKSKIIKVKSAAKVKVLFTEYGNSDYTRLDLLKPPETVINEDGSLDEHRSCKLEPIAEEPLEGEGSKGSTSEEEQKILVRSKEDVFKVSENEEEHNILVGSEDAFEVSRNEVQQKIRVCRSEDDLSENEEQKIVVRPEADVFKVSEEEEQKILVGSEGEVKVSGNEVQKEIIVCRYEDDQSENKICSKNEEHKIITISEDGDIFRGSGNEEQKRIDIPGDEGDIVKCDGNENEHKIIAVSEDGNIFGGSLNEEEQKILDIPEDENAGGSSLHRSPETSHNNECNYQSKTKMDFVDRLTQNKLPLNKQGDATTISQDKILSNQIGTKLPTALDKYIQSQSKLSQMGDTEAAERCTHDSFTVGDICVALWEQDGIWYNGQIEAINDDRSFLVKFIDYGNSDNVALSNIVKSAPDIPKDVPEYDVDEYVGCRTDEELKFSQMGDTEASKRCTQDSFTVGDICVALWEQDGIWYNGQIEATNHDGSFLVKFVDYGNLDKVALTNIVKSALDIPKDVPEYDVDEYVGCRTDIDEMLYSKLKITEILKVNVVDENNESSVNVNQIAGNMSLDLNNSIPKASEVADDCQSSSTSESRPLPPPAGVSSLSRNSESTLLGRVRSLAISEEGSKFLVSVMNQETVPTIQEELLSDALSVMLHPVASKVMQAVVEATEDLEDILEIVLDNFQILSSDKSGSRIIKHVLTRLPCTKKISIVAKLEKEEILADLLSSQQGTNVVQACIPHMTESSVASIVKFVLGNLVDLGNNPNGSYFIQLFMTSSNPSINKASKDSVLDAIVENVENLLKKSFGSCLLQTALKVSQAPRHIFLFSAWVKDNIKNVFCDPDAVHFASSVIEVLVNLSNSEEADLAAESEKILRELIFLMTDTLVEVDDSTVPLLVAASFDPYGHVLAREVCLQARYVPEIRNKFIQLFSQFKSKLEDDTFGSLVLKGLQGLL